MVVGKRTYSGTLRSESGKLSRNERKEWKSRVKEAVVETRVKMKEGMEERKSLQKVALDKLKGWHS